MSAGESALPYLYIRNTLSIEREREKESCWYRSNLLWSVWSQGGFVVGRGGRGRVVCTPQARDPPANPFCQAAAAGLVRFHCEPARPGAGTRCPHDHFVIMKERRRLTNELWRHCWRRGRFTNTLVFDTLSVGFRHIFIRLNTSSLYLHYSTCMYCYYCT